MGFGILIGVIAITGIVAGGYLLSKKAQAEPEPLPKIIVPRRDYSTQQGMTLLLD